MKCLKIALFAAAMTALAAPAFAQQGPMTPEQREARFVAGDVDKDGKLSKAEWLAQLPEPAKDRADQLWGRFDADGDGSVTKEQFMAVRMGQGQPPPQ